MCWCLRKSKRKLQAKEVKRVKPKNAILNQNSTGSNQGSNGFYNKQVRSSKKNSIKFIRQKVNSNSAHSIQKKKINLESKLVFNLGLLQINKLDSQENMIFSQFKSKKSILGGNPEDLTKGKKSPSKLGSVDLRQDSMNVIITPAVENGPKCDEEEAVEDNGENDKEALMSKKKKTVKAINIFKGKGGYDDSGNSSLMPKKSSGSNMGENPRSSPMIGGRSRINSLYMNIHKNRKGSEKLSPSPKNSAINCFSKQRMSINANFARGYGKGSFKISEIVSKGDAIRKTQKRASQVFKKLREEEAFKSVRIDNSDKSNDGNQSIRSGIVNSVSKKRKKKAR